MISKSKANYTNKAKKDFCEDCTMSRPKKPPVQTCTLVIGPIEDKGHCNYFAAKNKLPVGK